MWPTKIIWSPAGVCDSRVHSKFATASESKTESITSAGVISQWTWPCCASNSANLSMSRPDFEPKNKAASAISEVGNAMVKDFECVMVSIE